MPCRASPLVLSSLERAQTNGIRWPRGLHLDENHRVLADDEPIDGALVALAVPDFWEDVSVWDQLQQPADVLFE